MYDEDPNKLTYGFSFASNQINTSFPIVKLTENNEMLYILVQGTVVGDFSLLLEITDYVNNTWETSIQLTVFNWASKDWVKCKGFYQDDWTQWTTNYYLKDDSGQCLIVFDYW